jgi:Flp pilus assembly protein TadG
MLQRFRNADQGNVGMVFALSLLPVVGMAGGALDYTRATTTRQKLQAATDMAALGAATANSVSSDAQRIALAQSLFKANDTSGATVSASVAGDKVTVVADARVKTTLMSVMQVSEIGLSVRSTAARATSGPPACVLALNKTVNGAITFSGSADFLAVGCSVHSNSRSPSSLSISGSGSVTAAGFCSAGGVSTSKAITPEPRRNCRQIDDPFQSLPAPVTTGCTYPNLVQVQPNDQRTLAPGIYCGGLTIKGEATLQAGVYVIKGGLTINSQAAVSGSGVTFYLTGSGAGFTINGGGAVTLTAPTSGVYGGVLVFQDRLANVGATNTLNGGASTKLVGAIYTAAQELSVNGGSGFGQQSQLMPIVADQVKFSGSTTAKADVTGFNMAAPLPQFSSEAMLTD